VKKPAHNKQFCEAVFTVQEAYSKPQAVIMAACGSFIEYSLMECFSPLR